jgi:hypothetical protein
MYQEISLWAPTCSTRKMSDTPRSSGKPFLSSKYLSANSQLTAQGYAVDMTYEKTE